MSRAVVEVFVQLYEDGLIYRGKRLVNWDPVLHTAVSDLEVDMVERDGHMWHILYPFSDGPQVTGDGERLAGMTIATTRPETMLGDGALAVHPDDPRYRSLVGRFVDLPLCDRRIPIIADTFVDPAFGSGCVKITGAHDFNDYAAALRHGIPLIVIMDLDANMNDDGAGAVPRPQPLRGARTRRRRPRARRTAGRRRAAQASCTGLRPHRRGGRADAHRPMVRRPDPRAASPTAGPAAGRQSPRPRSRRSRAVPSGSSPSTGPAPTTTGSKTSRTGASRANSGGVTRSRPGTATAAGSSSPATRPRPRRRLRPPVTTARCVAIPTSSTPGSRRRWCRSPRSAGRTRRRSRSPTRSATCRRRYWSPATTSSSSGSPGW